MNGMNRRRVLLGCLFGGLSASASAKGRNGGHGKAPSLPPKPRRGGIGNCGSEGGPGGRDAKGRCRSWKK